MVKSKSVFGIILMLLLTGMLTLALDIEPVKSDWTWSENIYIRADGSIDPSIAPISTVDNVTYTLTDNIVVDIFEDLIAIVVERNNIVVDGAGYTLQGSHWGSGIDLSGRKNVTIKNIEIRQFIFGIYLSNSSDISIYNNNITLSEAIGIIVQSSSKNNVTTNNIKYNYIGIQLEEADNNCISGNQIVANGPGGGMFLLSSTNNSMFRNNVTKNWIGIGLYDSSNNSIHGNTVTNNGYGITLEHSSINNCIRGNNVTNNEWWGINLYDSSSNNSIAGNNVTNNEEDGISLDMSSSNNSIRGNNVASNTYGIRLWYSPNNSISENNVTSNWYGIYLRQSSNSIFYHNNFVNNLRQVCMHAPDPGETPSINAWDDGYPSGGNYWSNYSGVDLFSGAYQNETGSDGIGDTPYVIDEDNQDNYPLMKPWGPMKTVFNATWNEEVYPVTIVSNSTVTYFNFSQPLKQISFNVTGPNGSAGFCNITIPKALLWCDSPEDWQIRIDDVPITDFVVTENETHTSLYFTYVHTTHQVQIIGTTVIGEEERTLLGRGWGWMRLAHKEYVHGPAELYKTGDTQIELVITYQGEEYSRTWNIISHKEYKYGERYLCYSREWGFLIVGLHKHRRWQSWYAFGKGVVAFGFTGDPPCRCGSGGTRHLRK